ncbi:thioredoxin family protein [Pontimicrobium aquaticum]|uniref:Thioredoxin family protein n=1 Tax=Pontimicrobium aquaticum TaxID=2565367 RepID=A0A4U0ERS8_9FLAO|nr:thioredoxin family protein [Pontimicrobium aquaticum]TJY33904.1 thioredoxin family protein [Pontimicrobium aquaticum]
MIELLFFSSRTCSVCQVLKPKLLTSVTTQFPDIKFTIIDVEQQQELAAQHLVFTLPVVLIMVYKKEQYRFIKSFSVNEVIDKLERLQQLMR